MSVKNRGVSFSYIRSDSKYDRLGLLKYNGYAMRPADSLAEKEFKPSVLCFFPIDAWTDNRSNGGCGDNSETREIESECGVAGIDSSKKWIAHFNSFKVTKENLYARKRVCSYDVQTALGNRAVDNFNVVIGAMALLGGRSFHRQNEMRVKTWEQNSQDTIPIMAFIYTKSSGLANAKLDQKDLYDNTLSKRWVPIIKVDFPTKSADEVKFTYQEQDQAVTPGSSTVCSNYIESAVWGNAWIRELKSTKPQLVVTPTACARKMKVADTTKAFEEVKRFRNSSWPDAKDSSMEAQLRCLRGLYPNNDTWKIEPFRPFVNDERMNRAKCNPLGVSDEVVEEPVGPVSETAQDIVRRIQKSYTNIRTSDTPCLEVKTNAPRGHYYCSGTLVRGVGGSGYKPWDYSVSAEKLRSTSYSWIRSDVRVSSLAYSAGFILRSPSDAISTGVQPLDVGWRCLYAFSSNTSERYANGCNYKVFKPGIVQKVLANRNSGFAYGTCQALGVETVAKWNALILKRGKRAPTAHCSWNPEVPAYWDNVIVIYNEMMKKYPARPFVNELLLANLSTSRDGSKLLPYIDAFFYDFNKSVKGGKGEVSLSDARVWQCDYKKETGNLIPILRLDFKAAASQRFSYVEADQAGSCN
ncbi:DUF2599 domain-containing protein [Pseudomonas sichuanensis]|uniref:DUF2599 domain-containing protein n=1 Tax=Pseudomonas sichuanensis TaxID=2213015 RepID=A0ABV0DJV8_9PSED